MVFPWYSIRSSSHMSSLLSSANIITHFPVIGEQEKSVSVLSWRDELELESGIGDLRILCGTLLFVSRKVR